MAALAIIVLLLQSMVTFAADSPSAIVRTRLEPATGVAIGQPATLYIDVFTDEFFTSGINLPALNVPGAVIKLSDERAPHISDTIGGANWVGIEHKYSITPIVAADLTIPGFEVSAKIGPQLQLRTLSTAPMTLQVSVPAGAEDAFVTHDLKIGQKVDANLTALKAGDAFTRTIELTASGTPAMFIPDITLDEVPGLNAYPQAPAISDAAPDEPIAGKRTFAVTYVVQQAGDYDLPAVSIRWWDLDTQQIVNTSAPALHVHAVAAPTPPPPFSVPAEQSAPTAARHVDWRRVGIQSGIAIIAIALLWWLTPYAVQLARNLARRRRLHHRQYLDSEPHAYAQLRLALRHNNDATILETLYRWLDRVPSDTSGIAGRVSRIPDPDFRAACSDLFAQRYAMNAAIRHATLKRLRHSLQRARAELLSHHHSSRTKSLPALNPTDTPCDG